MSAALPYPPPFQDLQTLSVHICVGESTIENWIRMGIFPAPKKIGGKRLWEWKVVARHLANVADPIAASPDQQAEAIRNATRAAATNPHD
jgi:hypothetical protein